MHIKDLLRVMFHAYFVITTGATVSMYVCCLLFSPNAVFSPVDVGGILFISLVSDLSFFIFYSKKELNRKQMLLRLFIHILLIIMILLGFADIFNWVNLKSPSQIIVFILLVLGVYSSVVAITFYHDRKTADKLNDGLKKRYHS